MWRTVASRVALVILSLLIGIGLVEIFLRFQQPYFNLMGRRADWAIGRYRAHPVWHHWLRPNSITGEPSLSPAAYPSPMIWIVNKQGCRYPTDLSEHPASGKRRIIVMGDSFTEGYYQDTTFAAILERKLNQSGSGQHAEVINCGTSSYSPMLHYLRYKHHLARYRPDEVILNVDLTDVFDDNYRYGPQARWSPDGEPLEARPSARGLGMLADNLRYRFLFARLLFGNPTSQLKSPIGVEVFAYHTSLSADSARWQREVGFSLSLLQRLIDLMRRDSVEVTLTMYPYEPQLQARRGGALWNRAFEQEVRTFAERNRVRFWSAYDSINAYYGRTLIPLYWSTDFHFTPTGQQIWGSFFADYYAKARN